jgi:uncharacterized damage-inducible protein DinB
MTAAISLQELLAWSREAANFWKAHFQANPSQLELPCTINDSGTVQELVRHIWMADLRWAQFVSGRPMTPKPELPKGPFSALFAMHESAAKMFQSLLDDPATNWNQTFNLAYDSLPPDLRKASRRKLAAHALLHSHRHWAQLASLVRAEGFPSNFWGDLIFSRALE